MRRKHNKRLSLPKKGTDLRATMRLMIRPQGATSLEVQIATQSKHRPVSAQLTKIVDFLGYDVRLLPNYDKTRQGRVVYKIVGKDIPGGYRSFSFNQGARVV